MDRDIEKRFIHEFVIPRKRVRVQWELEQKDKRYHCLFYIRQWIIPEYIHPCKSIADEEDMYKKLKSICTHNDCYLIADKEADSRVMSIQEAIEKSMGSMTIITFCHEDNVAFYDDEEYVKTILSKQSLQ